MIGDEWTDDLPWIGQYILDDDGNPVPAKSLLAWGEWFETHRHEKIVAQDQIGIAFVSTVFLGLDHGAGFLVRTGQLDPLTYKPVLWETMVFGGPYKDYQTRYTSKKEALEGHKKIVQMLTS